MSFFNLGRTDEYGNQRRIEHRGRNLRASRTGGVALRAQAKAAGVNVTANTSTGFRASSTPLKNTQVALQNGRFVLKGRYSSGPFDLNLSKSGVSVATRNELGSFNWLQPRRSSAKFAGIQVRGNKAAHIQAVYMLLVAATTLLQLLLRLVVWLGYALLALLGLLYRLALATPYAVRVLRRRLRNRRLEGKSVDVEALFTASPAEWTRADSLAGLLLVFAGWGRGRKAVSAAEQIQPALETLEVDAVMREASPVLGQVARRLEVARNEAGDEADTIPQTCAALLSRQMATRLTPDLTTEAILQTDELALEQGPRTRLQEVLLEVFADFAGIRFQEPETPDPETADPEAGTEREEHAGTDNEPGIDLNSATREELESIPHLGPERAEQVMAMRPLNDLSQLTAIHGIGPARLEDIRAFGAHIRE